MLAAAHCHLVPPHLTQPPVLFVTAGFTCLTVIRSASNLLSALRASRKIHYNSLTSLVRGAGWPWVCTQGCLAAWGTCAL